MAHSHSHSSHSHGAAAGTDGMNLKKIVLVGVASLVIFAVGIVWAYFILSGQRRALREAAGEAKVATELGKPEIGIVDQVLFSHDNRLELWKAERAKHMNSYGWIDRRKGLAHMPIEEAMKRVIASPPDIAGEGVPPKAAPAAPPPTAAVDDESKKEKGVHKAGKSADRGPEKVKAEKAGGAP